ncbi:MAG TPA: hypothetical protein VN823_21495 [Stellaceae bacterium]|nr:hypothetical protein [Stellaceae bacterium]
MAKRTVANPYKAWLEALENMRAALTANPLVADPLMASAQVFEDIGRMMFGGHVAATKPKRKRATAKRSAAKKAPARKKPAARRRARKS